VSAFTSAEGASRQVLRRVLNSEAEALISLPLFAEYEAVLGRPETQRRCPLTATEQTQLLDAFCPEHGSSRCITVGGDAPIVTFNRRDFRSGELLQRRLGGIACHVPAKQPVNIGGIRTSVERLIRFPRTVFA